MTMMNLNCLILYLEVMALWSHSTWTSTTNYQLETISSTVDFDLNSTVSPIRDYDHVNIISQNKSAMETRIHKMPISNHLRKPCSCRNGGTCITSSVCECPEEFKGRFCQIRVDNIPCGNIQHGEVYYHRTGNCRVCNCFDGELICDDSFTCEDVTNLMNLLASPHHSGSSQQQPFPNLFLLIILAWHQTLSFWT